MAQRLVRKTCQNCKKPEKFRRKHLSMRGFLRKKPSVVSYKGSGCEVCNKTGYKGRVALYEVLPVKDEIKELILQGASVMDIKKLAVSLGMKLVGVGC